MQLARRSRSSSPGGERLLFFLQIISTQIIWAASHVTFKACSFFIFYSLSRLDQRHTMHCKSKLSRFHTIAATTNGPVSLSCVMPTLQWSHAHTFFLDFAFHMQLISCQCHYSIWKVCALTIYWLYGLHRVTQSLSLG